MRSFRSKLSLWLVVLILITAGTSFFYSYQSVKRYEGQVMDANLAQRARVLLKMIEEFPGAVPEETAQWALDSYRLFSLGTPPGWQAITHGRLSSNTIKVRFLVNGQCYSPEQRAIVCEPGFGEHLKSGFQSLDYQDSRWRLFSVYSPTKDAWIQAGYLVGEAEGLLVEAMWPTWSIKILVLVPLSLTLVMLLVSHVLKPLRELAQSLETSPDGALPELASLRPELQPIVAALARHRTAAAADRERQLMMADEVVQRSLTLLGRSRAAVELREPEQAIYHLDRLERQLRLASQSVLLEQDPWPTPGDADLHSELVQSVGRFQSLAGSFKVKLVLRPMDESVRLRLPQPVLQIFLDNLVEAAVRHAPGQSEVVIRFCRSKNGQPRLVLNCAQLPVLDPAWRSALGAGMTTDFTGPTHIGLARKVAERYGILLKPSRCERFGGVRLLVQFPDTLQIPSA